MGAEALTSRRTLRVLDDEGDLESGGDDDLSFWSDACADTSGPIFEFGCGGGRILAHLATVGRELIGIDIDPVALDLARRRLPTATLIHDDLLSWTPPDTLRRSVGLVIAGGDLLPLFTESDDLRRLFDQAAALLQPSGLFGIDATLIDRALLRDAVNDPEWSEDARWSSDGRGVVRRESRLLPDPARRPGHAQLQIRHWHDGDSVPDQRDPFPIRAWQPAEIARIAERAGLRLSRPAAHDRLRWLLRSGHV